MQFTLYKFDLEEKTFETEISNGSKNEDLITKLSKVFLSEFSR